MPGGASDSHDHIAAVFDAVDDDSLSFSSALAAR
jgi:hypothetical protein